MYKDQTHIVLRKNKDMTYSPIALEFTSHEKATDDLNWQVKGGFKREDYVIAARSEIHQYELCGDGWMKDAWNKFMENLNG